MDSRQISHGETMSENKTDSNGRRRLLPYYECLRCNDRFEVRSQVIMHLTTEHAGEGDGKMDYAANLHPKALQPDTEQ